MTTHAGLMRRTTDLAIGCLDSLADRPVVASAGRERLLADLGGPLPEAGVDAMLVIEDLRRGVEVLNDVVLDQVLVRFRGPDGADTDAYTRDVIKRVQDDGTCWLSGTTWHGMAAMRISVVNWSTTDDDIDRSDGRHPSSRSRLNLSGGCRREE
jgi:hypothetical protein